MRVLGLCDHYPPSVSAGGSERAAREVWSRLRAMGLEITIVAGPGSDASVVEKHLERARGFDLKRLIGQEVTVAPGGARKVRAVASALRPDVIHAHTLYFSTTRIAARVARDLRVPLVLTAHVAAPVGLSRVARTSLRAYERTIARGIVSNSAAVICVSEAVRDHVRAMAPGARTVVVPNGVDRTSFPPLGDPNNLRPTVGFVGRLIGNKGADVLIDACARLEDPRVLVKFVGDGPLRSRLADRARRGGVSAEFTGTVTDVSGALRGMDLVVRPSTSEGLPLAVLEAMSSRRPVVVSDIAPNRGLVVHGVNGLLHRVGDVRDLADQIRHVFADAALRSRIVRGGESTADAHDWGEIARNTAEVFRAAVGGAAR